MGGTLTLHNPIQQGWQGCKANRECLKSRKAVVSRGWFAQVGNGVGWILIDASSNRYQKAFAEGMIAEAARRWQESHPSRTGRSLEKRRSKDTA